MDTKRLLFALTLAAAVLFSACGAGTESSTSEQECPGGVCDCSAGYELCGGTCVSLAANTAHCGACNVACSSGTNCEGGACACLAGLSACSSGCVNTTTNGSHCGACEVLCEGALVCSQGACTDRCLANETQCGNSCVDVLSDSTNCGACDTACAAGQTCEQGVCTCPLGQTSCNGSCVDLAQDPSHCGSCGQSCGAQACSDGVCDTTSASGGAPGTGGALGSGGVGTGGATGGNGGATGGIPGSGGRDPGACDPGSTTTEWASDCATSAPSCVSGTWTDGGPEPSNSDLVFQAESDHFVIYRMSQISLDSGTVSSALNFMETSVWGTFFGSPMYMEPPYCDSATKYKNVIHIRDDVGLQGGSWGNSRMGMWVGPGALSDHWGLAHEFMHGVQSVHGGQSCNQSNTCGWIYESHANWAAQQQPEYHASDVHCTEMQANMPHLYLGSTRMRYCNWQFMEFLKDKHCPAAVHAIWTGVPAKDPFTAIRSGMNWSVEELNDFMGEYAMHSVVWDYQDPDPQVTAGENRGGTFRSAYGLITDKSQAIRRRRLTQVEPLDDNYAINRQFVSPYHWAPQRYGFNVIQLFPEDGADEVVVTFRGITTSPESPDFRWGLVATDSGLTSARYSEIQSGTDGDLSFCLGDGEHLFLVVSATPSSWYDIVWDQPYNTVPRYPYMFALEGAWPEGFRDGTRDDCPSGLAPAGNGGGCAPNGTSAYVGPYATVLSGATVSGSARIEDHAIVANGSVSGGTVGALSIIGNAGGFGANAFNMTGGSAQTTFYPLGFFESGQGLSGGELVGDVEYRGGGLNRNNGTCSGFVDGSTCISPGADATPAPPYAWR